MKESRAARAFVYSLPVMPLALCFATTCVSEAYTRNTPPPDRSNSPILDNAQSYSVRFSLDQVRSYRVKDGVMFEVPGLEIRDPDNACYVQTSDKVFPDHPFLNNGDCVQYSARPIPPRQTSLYFHFNDYTLPKVVTGTFQLDMKKTPDDPYSQNGGFFRYQIEITP